MYPDQMRDFGQSVVAVLLFASNLLFYLEIDYFAPAADAKPLLHTWSLAVEEQFYIFFPILMWGLWRVRGRPLLLVVCALSGLSLLGSQIAAQMAPEANFFLLPSRIWELGAGAICAIWRAEHGARDNALYAGLGLVMICVSIYFFDHRTPIPSLYALLPVGGTALFLLFATGSNRAGLIMTPRPVVWVGLISYSAYLWHQPIFAFAKLRLEGEPTRLLYLGLIAVTLGLAWLSWKYVEAPFRRPGLRLFSSPKHWGILVATALSLFAFGMAVDMREGLPERFSEPVRTALAGRQDRGTFDECLQRDLVRGLAPLSECALGRAEAREIDFLVVGDSFGAALADGLDIAAREENKRGAMFVASSCPAIPGLGGGFLRSHDRCDMIQSGIVETATELGVSQVLLVSGWHALNDASLCNLRHVNCRAETQAQIFTRARQSLSDLIAALQDKGISVRVVGAPPRASASNLVPNLVAQRLILGRETDVEIAEAEIFPERIALWLGELGQETLYFALSPWFCEEGVCKLSRDGYPLIRDGSHLTGTASRAIAPFLRDLFVSR